MSLHQRQEHLAGRGGFRAQLTNYNSVNASSGTQLAPINSRAGASSLLSNSLIPRDYLGARQHSPKEKYSFDADVLGFREDQNHKGGNQRDSPGRAGATEQLRRDQLRQSPSPESPPSSTPPPEGDPQAEAGTMPRTSSIDSAISSISTTSQPKSSTDAKEPSLTEIRNLIATAGSAENLVQHLLRDKQQAAAQNAQLWRLVDKQRALLLGLNKDLERLAKEKERYKKKFKEIQEQNQSQSDARPRKDSQSPLASNGAQKAGVEPFVDVAEIHKVRSHFLSTPDNKPKHVMDSSPIDPAMMPPPLHMMQQPQQQIEETSASTASDVEIKNLLPAEHVLRTTIDDEQMAFAGPTVPDTSKDPKPRPMLLMPDSEAPPSFALIEPSPLNPSPSNTFPPTRKAPPAPLRLESPQSEASFNETMMPIEISDVLIDDDRKLAESPTDRRGRRKTREQDDREREEVVMREQEARSRSKKETKPKPDVVAEREEDKSLQKPVFPSIGLPASPRHPPQLQDRLAPPGSLTAILQNNANSSKPVTEATLAPRPLSPGLPTSPRPTDRPIGSPLPRNPRDNAGVKQTLPLSPRSIMSGFLLSPRGPKPPVTLPASPRPNQANHSVSVIPQRFIGREMENERQSSPTSPTVPPEVYQELIDEAYPNFLLPPNALPSIQIKVASSRLRPSRTSVAGAKTQEENAVFTLSVFSRSNGQELWRLEKVILALPQMDQRLRPLCSPVPALPDRKLFNGHSPMMMDARRAALDNYFDELLDTEMDESAASVICSFLSTDVVEPRHDGGPGPVYSDSASGFSTGPDGRPKKTGYLTKRGKNFGGWKARFFVLDSPELRYFESPGGAHLGTIKLLNAQIGKQSQSESPTQSNDDDSQYRHAFLILEPKRKDSASLVRHVLCAESDRERDEWVTALLNYVDEINNGVSGLVRGAEYGSVGSLTTTGARSLISKPSIGSLDRHGRSEDSYGDSQIMSVPYHDTIAGTTPTHGAVGFDQRREDTTSSTNNPIQHANISGPLNATVIADAGSWGNKALASSVPEEKQQRKRNLFHFKQKNPTDLLGSGTDASSGAARSSSHTSPRVAARAVFGLPLAEAVEFCPPVGIDANLPAVVYRCIEYMRENNAANEEGLFRLSGSNVLIRTLKDRFNNEGDIDLLAEAEYYDVHAVASLFKTYMRELPNPLLTRELHIEFLRVLDIELHAQKVAAYTALVHRLPSVNYTLLRTLSEFLLLVVNNSDKNKMSIRNVGIVFSPTLNIPAPVFSIFLTDFATVFGNQPVQNSQNAQVHQQGSNALTPEDIRSPRRQMFSDLPTPAYNQTTFGVFPSNGLPQRNGSLMSAAETGFIPVQQLYESRNYATQLQLAAQAQHQQQPHLLQQASQQAEYGSLNRMMAPDNGSSGKAKRRESSLLFHG